MTLKQLLTREEYRAFEALAAAAELIVRLPELHPSERTEQEHEIHTIQMRLLARPGLRVCGWTTKPRIRTNDNSE